jgi:hypothetical protein
MRQTRSSDTLAVLMIPLTAAGFILIFPPRHDCSLPVSAKPEGYAAVAAFFVYQQERDFRRVSGSRFSGRAVTGWESALKGGFLTGEKSVEEGAKKPEDEFHGGVEDYDPVLRSRCR